jgi:hypothetical protein
MEGKMVISAVRSLLGNKLMISARVIALAVQFTMTRDAVAQSVTDQLGPLTDRQRGEVALPLSVVPATLAEKAGVYVLPGIRRAGVSARGNQRRPIQLRGVNFIKSGIIRGGIVMTNGLNCSPVLATG